MKCVLLNRAAISRRRSPCGERGLKLYGLRPCLRAPRSLPVRGAWVEIGTQCHGFLQRLGRSPCGERGLKYECHPLCGGVSCVAPRAGSVG